MILRVFLVLLTCAATVPAWAKGPVDSPVAVMPFKNLNQAADLQWLSQGIAETMVADLRKSGRVGVVERNQIASAVKEIQVQASPGSEVSQAVKVGKLVGARTIVVGSFQKAGGDIRITARFVSVETGVVQDTAKTTGPQTRIFALQDEITNRLLGIAPPAKTAVRKPVPVKRRPVRKSTTKEVEAYKLYALSLNSKTDTERRELLKKAVQVDPDFVYAADDLNALETRMAGYARISAAKFGEREAKIRDKLYAKDTPADQKLQLAQALLESLVSARRYYTLAGEAQKVYDLKLEPSLLFDASEYASWCLVLSHARLRLMDQALQHGERHLKEFPTGKHYRDAEKLMNKIVADRREEKERRAEYAQELRENEEERAQLIAEHGKVPEDRRVSIDYHPCIAAKWSRLPTEMIENCSAYIGEYAGSSDEDAKEFVLNARSYVVWGHALRGEFSTAWSLADSLKSDAPGQLADIGLQEVIDTRWPTD